MNKQEIENRLRELAAIQSNFFKKKKKERGPVEELQAARKEINELKDQVTALYKNKKS